MIRATWGGVELEIWFSPSFNIKTTEPTLEFQLRNMQPIEAFDMFTGATRRVKATEGIQEAYLVLHELSATVPEAQIVILEGPEPEEEKSTEENPVLY